MSDKVAADCLGVDVKQIRLWLESGALVGYRPTGSNWKIPREEINHPAPPPPPSRNGGFAQDLSDFEN